MHKFIIYLLFFGLLIQACYLFKKSSPMPERLLDVDQSWIDEKFQKMSLDQKIGQLLIISSSDQTYNEMDPAFLRTKDYITRYHIGGLLIKKGEAYQAAAYFNRLQSIAKIPLLITARFAQGVGQSITGGTAFISQMGLVAGNQAKNAYDTGRITAIEARALGFHLSFSPFTTLAGDAFLYDSFGQKPEQVSEFCAANIRGLQENGLLACATYFPGIGSSEIPDHTHIPEDLISFKEWQQTGLLPFSEAIRTGVAAIMAANFTFPNMDQGFSRPAAFSPYLLTEILRNRLRFEGLIVSDALTDNLIQKKFYAGDAAVRAIDAGVDLLIVEDNIQTVFNAIREAVQNKKILMQRIDASVKRILNWKSVLGLTTEPFIDTALLSYKLRSPASLMMARKTAIEAVTLINNRDLPLPFRKDLRIFALSFTAKPAETDLKSDFVKQLQVYFPSTETVKIDGTASDEEQMSVLESAAKADIIINSFYFKSAQIPTDSQNYIIRQIKNLQKPVINIFFDSHYFTRNAGEIPNILLAYSDIPVCQQAVAEILVGALPVSGKLPVSVPGIAPRESGDQLPQQTMALQQVDYQRVLTHPDYIDSLRKYLKDAITDGAFPGCAIAAGCRGKLFLQEAFGHFTYDPKSKIVQPISIFDLASITKVVATTTVTMILFDQGQLELDWRIADIIPAFKGKDKEFVTIRHLLTHVSGLPGWMQFYLTVKGKELIVREICQTDLIYQPGTKTIYSDLGMILMQKVLETITQKPLNLLVKEYITAPLGMNRTFYNPEQQFLTEIVPTEVSDFHKQLVRGFVHDENTFVMGGVSGHAGLFSTVEDLAVFSQMYLNDGIYNFKRILQPETIRLFTSIQNLVEGSTRAIGWDTRSEKDSMSGDYMSKQAYGHSGFTGTTIWIDPAHEIFVVLLTNRVHPTRENQKIRNVRPKVHNYIMKAVLD